MEKNSKKIIVALFSLTLLFAGGLQPSSAVNLDEISNYSIALSISPNTIEENTNSNSFGYVYILNRNNVPITSDQDVEITLTSDNSNIASVPEKITFPANSSYAKFEIVSGDAGKTTITAQLDDKIDFRKPSWWLIRWAIRLTLSA